MPTTSVFRVFTHVSEARAETFGHPLYSPISRQGQGRIDNPDLYAVVYASSSPAGAIAEAFGRHRPWLDAMFSPAAGITRALAEFKIDSDNVLNLDDAHTLAAWSLRPSSVITRHRSVTQAWAAELYAEARWTGVSWWSYYEAQWAALGIWNAAALKLKGAPAPLNRRHPAVQEASEKLNALWADEVI